jgi:hypothetical protein
MDIDIHIYVKSIKNFFDTNIEGRETLFSKFPGVEFDTFMREIERVASSNYDQSGDPTISKKQILDILQLLYAQTMGEGLQALVEEGNINVEKDKEGIPQILLTDKFKKELNQLNVFQTLDNLGPICLN